MKKALLLTDCSVDIALSLNRWMKNQSDPIDLTVVYAYTLVPDTSLKAAAFEQAKREAADELTRWLNFLSRPWPSLDWPGQLYPEILLGDPELVLTIHLLLRRYDYLLIDRGQEEVLSAFAACQNQVTTNLCWLSSPEHLSCSPDLLPEVESALRIETVNR